MTAPRLERESRLHCDRCNADPYIVYRRQVQGRDGSLSQDVYEHVLWPAHPNVAPPLFPARPECPDCGLALRRVTG